MATCSSADSVLEASSLIKANSEKLNKFVNGTDTQTVQLGMGDPTPTVRNVVRQMYTAAAQVENASVDGKTVLANGTTEARTLAERFADIINVKDFGAVGDGETDDTSAINAAFDAAEDSGAKIFVPKGTYIYQSTTRKINSLALMGEGTIVNNGTHINAGIGITGRYFFESAVELYISFGMQKVTRTTSKPSLLVSVDGISWFYVCEWDYLYNDDRWVYHASYHDSYYYITFEKSTGIYYYKTKDFKTLEEFQFPIDTSVVTATGGFGRCVFVWDNNDVCHAIFTRDTDVVVSERHVVAWYHVTGDPSTNTWGTTEVHPLSAAFTNNTIYDHDVILKDGVVYITCCNSIVDNSDVYLFKSNSFMGQYELVETFNHARTSWLEGPVFLDKGDTVLLYALAYGCGNWVVYSSSDMATWSNASCVNFTRPLGNTPEIVDGQSGSNVRSLGILNVSSSTLRQTFTDYCRWRGCADPFVLNGISFQTEPYQNYVYIKGTLDPLTLIGGTTYLITNETTIESFDISMLRRGDLCKIIFASSSETLTIKNSAFGDVRLVSKSTLNDEQCNYSISGVNGGFDNIITIKCEFNALNMSKRAYLSIAKNPSLKAPINSQLDCNNFVSSGIWLFTTTTTSNGSNFPAVQGVLEVVGGLGGVVFQTWHTYSYGAATWTRYRLQGVWSEWVNNGSRCLSTSFFAPRSTEDEVSLGTSDSKWSAVYAATATIQTSDEREKTAIQNIPDKILDAWDDVGLCQFKMSSSVANKGDDARLHTGVIAQRVKEAFERHGVDASAYGLFCHDEWGDVTSTTSVLVKEGEFDEDGNQLSPDIYEDQILTVKPAGDSYGIRYGEALCLEAACQRRRADRSEARIEALETRLAELEARLNEISVNGPAPSDAE